MFGEWTHTLFMLEQYLMMSAWIDLHHKEKQLLVALMILDTANTASDEVEAMKKVRFAIVGAGIGGEFGNTAETQANEVQGYHELKR